MSKRLTNIPIPDYITEDNEPVDSLFTEKQQRLLTQPLYSYLLNSGRKFIVCSNIGIFKPSWGRYGIAPDVMLSMDVSIPHKGWKKKYRSYFMEKMGKPPDVVIEIVSISPGGELGEKKEKYLDINVPYYVIFDPLHQLSKETLSFYQLQSGQYVPYIGYIFPLVGLGLKLWEGVFEGQFDQWLRWVDAESNIIPTSDERIDEEKQRAEKAESAIAEQTAKAEAERQRANEEKLRAEAEKQRADQMEAILRQMGIDPNSFKPK